MFCLVPSAPPSNIIGGNTSSTSLKITWEDVPKEHRNGIILDYKVYMKLSTSGSFPTPTIVSSKSYEKAGLQYWTIYDIRIAARTSVGTGEKSNILQVRTDEDSKSCFHQELSQPLTEFTASLSRFVLQVF